MCDQEQIFDTKIDTKDTSSDTKLDKKQVIDVMKSIIMVTKSKLQQYLMMQNNQN